MYFYENDFMGQRRVAELLYTDIIKDEPISCKFCDLPYHKFPYITMDFIRVNDNQPAIPLLSKVKSNSTLKTIFLNKIMRLGNMYSRKILLPKSWITDKNMFNKINSAKNEYIGYEDRFGDNDIKQKIYEVNQDTSVLNLLIQLSGYVDAENEQIAKTSTRDRQGQGPDTTATQSVITENAAKRMTGMYISEIDEFSQQICEFQNLIVDAKYDSEDFVEIAGKDLSKDVVQYNIKDLYGLYRISIKYGSSSQQMRQLEAEQLLQSFATLYQSEFCVGQYKRNALVIFGRKTGWDDSEIDLMLMPSVREITPNDELYILMTSGQMPPPTDTEDFEFHLSEHELQKQNINGSQMLTDEQKVMVLKAIEQHIMMTEEMQSQADNKGKSIDTSGDKYSKHPKGIESGGKENKQISEATSPKEFVAEEK